MATTQQHIDELITTIFYATQDRSVTNVMVGRVLDWLNKRAGQLQSEIESGRRECVKEYEEINRAIASIRENSCRPQPQHDPREGGAGILGRLSGTSEDVRGHYVACESRAFLLLNLLSC